METHVPNLPAPPPLTVEHPKGPESEMESVTASEPEPEPEPVPAQGVLDFQAPFYQLGAAVRTDQDNEMTTEFSASVKDIAEPPKLVDDWTAQDLELLPEDELNQVSTNKEFNVWIKGYTRLRLKLTRLPFPHQTQSPSSLPTHDYPSEAHFNVETTSPP